MNQDKFAELEREIRLNHSNITGIVVSADGKTQYENYFNECTAASKIHVYSVTKSILSILIGIAIDKGCIESVHQRVLDFFPDYTVKKREKTIQNITLENLLTMTAPYKFRSAPYIKYFTSDDWLAFTLDLLGGKRQIGEFNYAPLIGPDILSGILVKATGRSVLDFARDVLFSPLDINVEGNVFFHNKEEQLAFNKARDINGWVADPNGLNAGGWGLTLSPVDMVKIGRLYLEGGLWNGRRLVSPGWIEESTREHSRWEKLHLSYGYLWWLVDGDEPGFAAMGDGGNILYVNPRKKLSVAITAFFISNAGDRIELIKKYIEPALSFPVLP